MTAVKLLGLGINLSMAMMVLGVALSGDGGRRWREVIRRSGLLARALIAMFVVMPVIAVLIAKYLDLAYALLVALLLLALSPVPPLLPPKQVEAGEDVPFVLDLLLVAALAAIVVVPAGVDLIGRLFGREVDVPFAPIARVVGVSVLLPVVVGVAIARFAPAFASRAARPVSKVAGVLLLVSVLPVVWIAWDGLTAQMRDFTVLALVVFVAIGLLVGHLLGGPQPDDRTALALATSTRHPGVAVAVLHAIEPANKDVVLVVVLYLLVGAIASLPYVKWRTRVHAAEHA